MRSLRDGIMADINTVLDFITKFQAAGREVSDNLRSAHLNLHVNSSSRRTSQAQKEKTTRFAKIASEVVLRSVERQIADYSRQATGEGLFEKEGGDPDGRKVLLNMLIRDGIDTMRGRTGKARSSALHDEMERSGIENPSRRDINLYSDCRTAIAGAAMHIIESIQTQPT